MNNVKDRYYRAEYAYKQAVGKGEDRVSMLTSAFEELLADLRSGLTADYLQTEVDRLQTTVKNLEISLAALTKSCRSLEDQRRWEAATAALTGLLARGEPATAAQAFELADQLLFAGKDRY